MANFFKQCLFVRHSWILWYRINFIWHDQFLTGAVLFCMLWCVSAFENKIRLHRLCLIRPKPHPDFKIWILKPQGCKQTESSIRIRFLENKCKINLNPTFNQDVENYYFYQTNFIKMELFCFHCFLFSNYGLWIDKTNCLKFPLTLAHRRPPS